jgi:uncharacterized protein DUF5996
MVFWGGFDLATTRFSGRPAPAHPGVRRRGTACAVAAPALIRSVALTVDVHAVRVPVASAVSLL